MPNMLNNEACIKSFFLSNFPLFCQFCVNDVNILTTVWFFFLSLDVHLFFLIFLICFVLPGPDLPVYVYVILV